MRKLLWIMAGFALFGGVAMSLVDPDQVPETKSSEGPTPEQIAAAKEALEAEKKVEGVYYDPSNFAQWQIGMINDGSSRVGYASYVCNVLKEKKALSPGTRVRIIDIANLLVPQQDRNMKGMGTVRCDDYKVINAGDMRPVLVPSR